VLQAIQAPARLHSRVKVGGGQRQAGGKCAAAWRRAFAQAQAVRGIGFLRRDDTASEPLPSLIGARERNGTNGAIIGNNGSPHVEAQATIAADRAIERIL